MPMYEKPMKQFFAGTSSVVNDNNVPIVPQQFQTQTYYPPQGSVISDPNLATPPMANQQFGMMPMQQKSIPAGDQGAGLRGLVRSGESDTVKEMGYNPATAQMKKYGAQQISMPESLKEMGKTAASYILGGGPPSLIPAAYAASALVKAKESVFGSERQAKESAKDWAQKEADKVSGN